MKTLVIGLGNPILGDDGVGWKIAEEVEGQLPLWQREDVHVERLSLGGISLMEQLIGYDRAILVDAFAQDEAVGSVFILPLSDLPNYSAFHTTNVHDTSLQNAIELGREMGAQLPDEIIIVGIATYHIYDFSEELSPPVAQAVHHAVQIVLDLLGEKVTSIEEESHPHG